ncbi:MAG: SusC/RagA family TonB-linked outer membrane protein, partial [Cyclobacteriaceae bacterium]|nr:SusC/RagA family TonB-linked outer membrane protein [Cyclobacteriaceae bacterium]
MFTSMAWAQNVTVSGKVTDGNGDGLPGVTVLVKGTTSGTSTDFSGGYSITAASSDVLVFSYIGYASREVTVGNQSTINVTLQEDVQQLSELVVTGYTIDTRRETSGSVSTVSPKDLTVVPTGNVEQTLQGRVAGVTVVTNGQPGTNSQIRVRGFGAFGGNAPLYIVDGVPVGSTNFLSPGDIESTTVLKDAAAASIYGARAANGVIIYTTKKGKKGDGGLRVDYDLMVGTTLPGKGQEMLNPQEHAEWTWKKDENNAFQTGDAVSHYHPQFGTGSTPVIPDYLNVGGVAGVVGNVNLADHADKYNVDPSAGSIYQVVKANKQGTDWYDELTSPAPLVRHNLGFSGGGEGNRFYIGFSKQDQDGIVMNQKFQRYTFRANSEFDLLPNLRLGENLQFTYLQILGLSGGGGGSGSADDENDILSAFRMPTIIPVRDEFGGWAGTAAKGFNNPRNPIADRTGQANNRGFDAQGFGNMYLEFNPIEDITLRSSLGGGYSSGYWYWYGRRQYENSENNSAFSYGEGSWYNLNWVVTNTASYKKKFDAHSIDIIVGQEALNTGSGRNISASGQNPFSQDPDYVNITNVGSQVVNSGFGKGVNFYSIFGRANYMYDDKYIVSAVIRRDGSSRFGSENRYGVFPAFSAAWRISSEAFMQSATFIDDLKIRGGYGMMGNSNNVDPNNQYSLYGGSIGSSSYDITGSNSSIAPGFIKTRNGNPNAKWETSVSQNIGFDGTLLDGKWDVIFDLWKIDTRDLLFVVPVSATAGEASAPSVNVGQMLNKGIDIQIINKGDISADLGYEVNLTGSFLHNEIVSLTEGIDYITYENPSYRGVQPIRNMVGHSLSAFYGYEMIGFFKDQADVDAHATQSGAGPGRFKFKDQLTVDTNGDGIPDAADGEINSDDRGYLGSPVPKFTGGLTFTLTYKNFDVAAYLYTSIGNKIWHQSKWFTDFYPSFAGAAIGARVKESWQPGQDNTNALGPIFESAANFSTNLNANSWYMEDGSYLRLQNITVGYTLPEALYSKLKVENLRVFASTNNLWTITGYSGMDPGVGGDVDTRFGIDVGNFPL